MASGADPEKRVGSDGSERPYSISEEGATGPGVPDSASHVSAAVGGGAVADWVEPGLIDTPSNLSFDEQEKKNVAYFGLRDQWFRGLNVKGAPCVSIGVLDPLITVERHHGKYHITARFHVETTIVDYNARRKDGHELFFHDICLQYLNSSGDEDLLTKPKSDVTGAFTVTRTSSKTVSGDLGVSLSGTPSANISLGISQSRECTIEHTVNTWSVSAHRYFKSFIHNMAQAHEHFVQSLCDLQVPKTLQLSPDRSSVLYSTELSWGHRKGKHPVSTVWLASTGRADSSRQLTRGLFRDYAPAWSPDGNAVAFVSDRADAGSKWAIYLLPLQEGCEAYPITPEMSASPIEAFAFSPDGSRIAFLSADEDIQLASAGDGPPDVRPWGETWRFARLRVVDLRTKQVRCAKLDRHVTSVCWSPDGTRIGFSSCLSPDIEESHITGTTVSAIDVDLSSVEDLCHFPKMVVDLSWAADGSLYFCGGVPPHKMFAGYGVYRTNPATESHNYEWVGFGVEDDSIGLVQHGSGTIFVKVQHRLESRVCLLDGTVLYSRKEELEAFDSAIETDGKFVLAVATSNINHPTEVFTTLSSGGGAMTRMSNHGQEFAGHRFGTCSFLTCTSADGEVELDALYLTPASSSDGANRHPLATVVLIHGGPNTRLTDAFNTYYYMLTPYLLSLGYGILMPNYRGSSGRGRHFASYSIGGLGVYDYSDVIALTQCAIDQGYADKERLLVGGWSQGGFLTNLCCVRNDLHHSGWRFRAAVSGASICDIDAMALTSDLGCAFEPELSRGGVAWNMDYDDTRNRAPSALWAFKDAARRASLNNAPVVPPMLILHGEADARCHVSQAWGLRRALSSYGLPFELVIYPSQGHFFEEQKYWVDMALRIGRWCQKYIGDALA